MSTIVYAAYWHTGMFNWWCLSDDQNTHDSFTFIYILPFLLSTTLKPFIGMKTTRMRGVVTATVPHLVEVVVRVKMRPINVAGIQGLLLLCGLSFLVHPIVELQHAVHPAPSRGVVRHRHRAVRFIVHTEQWPAGKCSNKMSLNE